MSDFELFDGAIDLPDGVTIVDVHRGHISMYRDDDTPTEQVTMYINGHEVTVIRYDGGNSGIVVNIDGTLGSMTMMSMSNVGDYILRNTR